MPDRDEESFEPFIEDPSSEDRWRQPGSKSWTDSLPFQISSRWNNSSSSESHSRSRSSSSAPRLSQRRRTVYIALAISLSFIVLFLFHTSRKSLSSAPPPPPEEAPYRADPFLCSTWESAKPIPAGSWSDLYRQYRFWTKYDRKDAFKLIPEQLPAPHAEGTKTRSSSQSLVREEAKIGEEKSERRARASKWKKPEGIKIIGLVFYGRPHLIDILDCYLYENLVHQGGYLDEVHFVEHTGNQADLEWLHKLVDSTPGYKALEVAPKCRHEPHSEDCSYERMWEHFGTEDDTLYIKMDDDMVYFHEDTIPRLVHSRINHAQPYAISANLINGPITAWQHYHLGAIRPYLPEPAPVPRTHGFKPTWRASELPVHPHDSQYQNLALGPIYTNDLYNSAIPDDDSLQKLFGEAPFPGHRWLPLTQNTTSLLYTPMSRFGDDPWRLGVHLWATAAQQHYSFFQNLEEDVLHRYYMASVPPHGEGLWNTQYIRTNLNFVAVWGKDVREGARVHREFRGGKSVIVSDMNYDEKNMTADIPRTLGRPFVVDVQAIVSHLHFGPSTPMLQMTDLLDRYRAYANEKVCPKDRQKKVPGQHTGLAWPEGQDGWWQCPWIGNEHRKTEEEEEEEEGEMS